MVCIQLCGYSCRKEVYLNIQKKTKKKKYSFLGPADPFTPDSKYMWVNGSYSTHSSMNHRQYRIFDLYSIDRYMPHTYLYVALPIHTPPITLYAIQVRSFYKGVASPMLGVAVLNAILFGVHGNIMKNHKDTIWNLTFAGAVSGGPQSIICSPMELIKLRMQVQTNRIDLFHWSTRKNNGRVYRDPWDAFKKILKKNGVRGIFKGLELTLLRDIPGYGVYFGAYYYICGSIAKYLGNGTTNYNVSLMYLCLAGGVSGVLGWVVTYPVDVVKSRIQVDGMFGERKYKSIWDCCVKSLNEPEGYRIFFKGMSPTIIRGFAVNVAILPTVTLILRFWH